VWALADLNLVALTGVATRDATLREKSSGQVKAEFSFEVERPFMRTTGEPVSDLFLVDVWQDLGKWTAETIKEGQRLFILGTLNKESYSTRGGREHLTIVKAKYIRRLDSDILDGQIDIEALKQDTWPPEVLRDAVRIVDSALREESIV
jgi:single-stranded DNA-binding protein